MVTLAIRGLLFGLGVLICLIGLASAQSEQDLVLSGGEYFLDTDPGEGQGKPLTAVDGTFDEVEEEIAASLATMQVGTGPHLLCVRLRDSEGTWGPVCTVAFEVLDPEASSFTQHIVEAEYYLDRVAEGAGIPMQAADGTFDEVREELVAPAVNTGELGIGEHTIYVRARDAQGRWGVFAWRKFAILEPEGGAQPKVAGGEYYFDRDPGEGRGCPMEAVDGCFDEAIEELGAQADAALLAPGWHTLYVRVRDTDGLWGVPRGQLIQVGHRGMDLFAPAIGAAEYRVVSKNAILRDWSPMAPEEGAFNSAAEVAVASLSTESLPLGNYTVHARMKDLAGRWGAIAQAGFSVVPDCTAVLDELANRPNRLVLHSNFPNPFNSATKVKFALPREGYVQLRVYDTLGRVVKTLVSERLEAGVWRETWDGRDDEGKSAATGVYLYVLEFNHTQTLVRKLVLAR